MPARIPPATAAPGRPPGNPQRPRSNAKSPAQPIKSMSLSSRVIHASTDISAECRDRSGRDALREATTGTTRTARTARERLAELLPQTPIEVISASVLRTPRFHLRPLSETDREEFIRVIRLSREHLERFSELHLPEETDEQLFERQLGLTQRGEASGLALRRVAVDSSGRIVGSFNLNSITRGLTWGGDLNWWVSVDSLRRGFATECVGAIVTHALRDLPHGLGLHEVRAFVQRENEWSVRIAEALGFVKEGAERAHLQTGDKWHVHDLYVRRVPATER